MKKLIRNGGDGGQQFSSISSITNWAKNVITCRRIFCHSVSALHDFHYSPFAVVQMEWLVSLWAIPEKWHARSTPWLYFTAEETDNPWRHQRPFSEKQKIDKPVIVLTDLPHCYQSLQILVGLVGVDVVQWAAVPGVSVGGCEINGNLVGIIIKCATWTIWQNQLDFSFAA